MIVNTGKLKLLDSQNTYLSSLVWGLFTSNTAIGLGTVLADLTEAGWTGYSQQAATAWTVAVIVSDRALSRNTTLPAFLNTSGSTQNFFGWMLIDLSGAATLIAADNIGSTNIPDGGVYVLAPAITDTQE